MKKLYTIFSLLLVSSSFAQQSTDSVSINRFFYNTKILSNPQKADQITEGVAVLDIDQSDSRFTDYGNQQRNELKEKLKDDKTLSSMDKVMKIQRIKAGFTWSIYSNAKENKLYQELAKQKYFYSDPKNTIQWRIDPEVTQWEGYNVQKATASYGGRVWYVLFTSDIPVLNGPYKFNNLPGFVVKAWDGAQEYVFEFTKSQNMVVAKDFLAGPTEYAEITKKQAKKADKVHYNKTAVDLLLDLNPKNREYIDQYPQEMKTKVILTSNPIEKDF
ncbi:GLPGLI family protein [Myroides sp. M-43]|uniref:GLPGLI family protein n=1 Tax=Myroides oncorhynchi TaxID=2893756 RepID=UPI001E641FD5|nr:GLPGLI family protein [Myroides oncorhynchi]MCC9044051.1 GLPGLI family protein [Myroides oncorhynchi]